MITIRCKCRKSLMKFNRLKEGDISEYEGSCCKDAKAALEELVRESEDMGLYDLVPQEPIVLSQRDAEAFTEILENPAEPSEALKSLMQEQNALRAERSEKSKKKFTYFDPKKVENAK